MDADVIVIGAGAAGLAAARSLASRSHRVILLEARDRTGGRVWTGPSALGGVPAELGAEFIHGPAPETRALLHEAGTAYVDTGGESWAAGPNGELQQGDGFSSAVDIFHDAHDLDADESVARYLRRFDTDPRMRAVADNARAFVEGFDAADPLLASVRGIAFEWESGVDSISARPIGGYRPLFERLEDACDANDVDRRLSTVVRGISRRPGSVSVEVINPNRSISTLRAYAAIVTLPVGVLHNAGQDAVVFDPPLPVEKLDALAHIASGDAVKVSLWFKTAFWEELRGGRYRDAGFFRGANQPFTAYWTQVPVRSQLICAWAGGPKATAMSGTPTGELIERALTGFGAVLGEPELVRSEFEGGVMHDWHNDPFARGAYSYLTVDAGNAREVLAAPVDDVLFFAGEATANDGQGGTVNGALVTGERAAREVAEMLANGR